VPSAERRQGTDSHGACPSATAASAGAGDYSRYFAGTLLPGALAAGHLILACGRDREGGIRATEGTSSGPSAGGVAGSPR
jgi:hypothetical protein